MPVVTKVQKDKDRLLGLFLGIDNVDVKDQLKRCKEFFTTFHNDDKGGSGQNGGLDGGFDFEEEGEAKEGEGKEEAKTGEGKTPSSEEVKKKEEPHV